MFSSISPSSSVSSLSNSSSSVVFLSEVLVDESKDSATSFKVSIKSGNCDLNSLIVFKSDTRFSFTSFNKIFRDI